VQSVEQLALTVAIDVEGGGVQQGRVVTEEAEAVVAALTQDLADLTGLVIVIQVLGIAVTADGATVALLPPDEIDIAPG
jgi:hypothetical protein